MASTPYRFIFLLFIALPTAIQANWGHRGGHRYFKHLPENSLIALESSLAGGLHGRGIQSDERFMYLEFDIQETLDGYLIVFHDRTLGRMIPTIGSNADSYKALRKDLGFMQRTGHKRHKDFAVKNLTLAQLKTFHLKGPPGQRIPTLEEYLDAVRRFKLKKPMFIDIKLLRTEEARRRLVVAVEDFLGNHDGDIPVTFRGRGGDDIINTLLQEGAEMDEIHINNKKHIRAVRRRHGALIGESATVCRDFLRAL